MPDQPPEDRDGRLDPRREEVDRRGASERRQAPRRVAQRRKKDGGLPGIERRSGNDRRLQRDRRDHED